MRLLDASVLVAAITPEARSREALSLLDGSPLVINGLAWAETRVAVIRKCKLGFLNASERDRALDVLARILAEGQVGKVPHVETWWDEAASVASRVRIALRTQDAYHAACALALKAQLATFDADLADAARELGLTVLP